MLGSSDGVAFVAVDRPADSLDSTLRSAIADVEYALPGIHVLRDSFLDPTRRRRPGR
jgi:hypothetical protein